MSKTQIQTPGPLLTSDGRLTAVGWSPHPILDCNLEQARFYPFPFHWLQFLRIKRWDYYALFTPRRFFSATIAHLGYAGNVFVYTLDWETKELHEEGLLIPLGRGIQLPRNSQEGESRYEDRRVRLVFRAEKGFRHIQVDWPAFHGGRGIYADFRLECPPDHESMTIVIPIGRRRFYYNRKINCMPASGWIRYGEEEEELRPDQALGSLDWGRGVWEYRTFWNWASASGFLPDGRRIGLNLGYGFGDTSAATENCLILEGKVHKLGIVYFDYRPDDYMHPWRFTDDEGRLNMTMVPFKERVARTNLGILYSEFHQIFGHYEGQVITDNGEVLSIRGLIGFTEEHRARW